MVPRAEDFFLPLVGFEPKGSKKKKITTKKEPTRAGFEPAPPKGNDLLRILVIRIRPLCHRALNDALVGKK